MADGVALLEVKTCVKSCHCLTVFGQAVLIGMSPLLTQQQLYQDGNELLTLTDESGSFSLADQDGSSASNATSVVLRADGNLNEGGTP